MPLDPWNYADKTGSEFSHQAALFMWANMAEKFGLQAANEPMSYNVVGHAMAVRDSIVAARGTFDLMPQLKWLHAIHNQGHGDAIRGAKAKAEGLKAGVADIFLPVPNYTNWKLDREQNIVTYCGLYIELKPKASGKPSTEQLDFQTDMRANGYKCEIIHGWQLARDEILRYLGYS